MQCLTLKNKKLLIFDEKSLKVVWMKTLKIPEKSLETPETAKGVISFEKMLKGCLNGWKKHSKLHV